VKLVEPPSCRSASSVVFIGKNKRGNWVAQEQNGLYGGLFVNRAQAVKYALFENGHHPETIVELSRELELDIGGQLLLGGTTKVARERMNDGSRHEEVVAQLRWGSLTLRRRRPFQQ
jgi:hypothetical protein